MVDTQQLITTLVERVKDLLASRSVTGEPVTVGDITIVPIAGYGFGFGGGSGTGTSKGETDEGDGAGAAAGGGIKPVALVIIDKDGARVESVGGIRGQGLVESIGKVVEHVADTKKADKKEAEKES